MSTPQGTNERKIHPDFPFEPVLGAIGGSQPKLLLCRRTDGTYGSLVRLSEEIMHRFTCADDLAGQLVTYFKRKKMEYPEWDDQKHYERIRLALIEKANEGKWPYTDAEQGWIMDRLRERSAS